MTIELVHQALEQSAQRFPEKTAVVCGASRRSYAEMNKIANRVASALSRSGVRRGDRVAIRLENSVETVAAIFGALKAGAVFSAIHPAAGTEKLRQLLRDEQPSVLIVSLGDARARAVPDELGGALPPVVVGVGGVPSGARVDGRRALEWGQFLDLGTDRFEPLDLSPEALGTIIYTSGTTDEPKGVMALHRDMVFAMGAINSYLSNGPDDVIFCALPLSFTYGLYQLLTAVLAGATLVLERNFAFPYRALQVMVRERVTALPGVPTTFGLLAGLRSLEDFDLSSLRYVTNAAAPLSTSLIERIQTMFPKSSFYSMYGQTECKRTTFLPPEQLEFRPESVGVPLPGTEAYVADPHGVPLPAGQVGELVVRGPHLMAGYWNKPDATARRLRADPNGGGTLMFTGDLFRADTEGYLYFVSRIDDLIKSGGRKVSPNEIEAALKTLPGVREVAAVGVPDDILGEAVKVVVVADRAEVTDRDVRAFCEKLLAHYMVPKYVEFREDLPRSENGKVARKELR